MWCRHDAPRAAHTTTTTTTQRAAHTTTTTSSSQPAPPSVPQGAERHGAPHPHPHRGRQDRQVEHEGETGLLLIPHLPRLQVDKTGKSYYGETGLFHMNVAGQARESQQPEPRASHTRRPATASSDAAAAAAAVVQVTNVKLSKEGPIHDVQWSPKGDEFIAVFGYSPSKAVIFNTKCEEVYNFGEAPRNTVRWSAARAGFGNLSGEPRSARRQVLGHGAPHHRWSATSPAGEPELSSGTARRASASARWTPT